jgi:hypothetical protein
MSDDETGMVWLDSIAEGELGVQVGGGVLVNVHPESACAGRPCVLHNPSDHHMRDWKLNWRDDRGFMERLCPDRGIGHPDPDDMAYHRSQGRGWIGTHGCDGCCAP